MSKKQIKIHCKYDALLDPKDLKDHPKNRNKHGSDQIENLATLYSKHGVRHPIIVSNLTGFIVAGHARKLSAIRAGIKIPVVYQDFESQKAEYGFLQSDNASALWAELDIRGIHEDVLEFGEFDIDSLGIKDFSLDFDDNLNESVDENNIPDIPKDVQSKLGDLYELGNHRIMCGDSTSIDAVEMLLNGENADITFTSPPYNASKNCNSDKGFHKKYKGYDDNISDDEYLNLLTNFTSIGLEKSKFVFVNLQLLTHNKNPIFRYQNKFMNQIKDILIWNKKQCPPNIVKGAFNTKWEYVFCFSKDNANTRGFPCNWQGQYPNVIETESNTGNEFSNDHKAGFPVSFPLWFLEKFDFSKSVLDFFGGTGTTLIACEKTKRKCFMMEINPQYIDIIVSRYCNYIGKTEVVKNGEKIKWDF